MSGKPPRTFFDEVVEATGLSRIIGPAAVARACVRAGVDSSALHRGNLERVIPHLQLTLEIYLREGVPARMRTVKALMHRVSKPRVDHLDVDRADVDRADVERTLMRGQRHWHGLRRQNASLSPSLR